MELFYGNKDFMNGGRNRVIAAILALFLGHFGIQRFYLGRPISGFILLALFWTGIPTIWGFIECISLMMMSDGKFNAKYPSY